MRAADEVGDRCALRREKCGPILKRLQRPPFDAARACLSGSTEADEPGGRDQCDRRADEEVLAAHGHEPTPLRRFSWSTLGSAVQVPAPAARRYDGESSTAGGTASPLRGDSV